MLSNEQQPAMWAFASGDGLNKMAPSEPDATCTALPEADGVKLPDPATVPTVFVGLSSVPTASTMVVEVMAEVVAAAMAMAAAAVVAASVLPPLAAAPR